MTASNKNYTITLEIDQSAETAFNAINNVGAWWTKDVEGRSENLDDIFTVRFGETFITLKIVELIPGKKIVWHVIDCYKHWLKNKKEWKDTAISWEISTDGNTTKISFVHIGLIPGMECYEGCERAWNSYIEGSLLKMITEGKGVPELK